MKDTNPYVSDPVSKALMAVQFLGDSFPSFHGGGGCLQIQSGRAACLPLREGLWILLHRHPPGLGGVHEDILEGPTFSLGLECTAYQGLFSNTGKVAKPHVDSDPALGDPSWGCLTVFSSPWFQLVPGNIKGSPCVPAAKAY